VVDEGWVDVPLLKLLPAPRPEWIVAPGALALAVSTPPGVEPYGWQKAVAVAWARSASTGTWGVLLAWEALRRLGPMDAVLAPRWGWCRFEAAQCEALEPTRIPNPWGQAWWGGAVDGQVGEAMQGAVQLVPPELREGALIPAGPSFDAGVVPEIRGLRGALGR